MKINFDEFTWFVPEKKNPLTITINSPDCLTLAGN